MLYRRVRSFAVTAAILLLAAGITVSAQESAHRGRKYKPPPPTSRIEVTILRSIDGKPIENASVIFKLKGDKGNMELKTNEDGKAVIDVLPINSDVELQVIAKGFQTYGEDFKIDKAELAIGVKMKRPGEQYSIYPSRGNAADAGKDAAPAPAKDKPSGSSAQPDAQPSQPQPK